MIQKQLSMVVQDMRIKDDYGRLHKKYESSATKLGQDYSFG